MIRIGTVGILLGFVAAGGPVTVAWGQRAPEPATPLSQPQSAASSSASPLFAAPGDPEPPPPEPRRYPRERLISAGVAAQLAARIPKYAPPPPKPPPAAEEPDLRDIDQPKNHIVRLPAYVVHAPPPPVFSERAISTKKGLEDIAMKRYMTETDRALNAFTLPLFGTPAGQRALSMYEEDERLKNMADLTEDARMVSATDKAAGVYVKREVQQTFMRPGDFDWKPIGR